MPGVVCIVGPQPPPLHGVSAFNKQMVELAGQAGLSVKCFNTAPVSLDQNLVVRLARFRPVLGAALGVRAVMRANPGAVMYGSVSGGYGMLGEILVWRVARSYRAPIVLHHHSFRYLDQPFAPMRWLARAAGLEAIHVLLSDNMEKSLRNRYAAQVRRTLVVPNAAFINHAAQAVEPARPECRVIGLLSNLSAEKGLFDVMELAEWAAREGLDFEFRIAGRFDNEAVRRDFDARAGRLKNLTCLGPLDEAEKKKFFAGLDVFLFPTHYRNEAAPAVVLEALSQGCPVISYERGCISSFVDATCGVLVPRDDAFSPVASQVLQTWRRDQLQTTRRRAAREKFDRLFSESLLGRQTLMDLLSGKGLSAHPA